MKNKLFLLLLLASSSIFAQVPADATPIENIQLTNNVQDNTSTKVVTQTNEGVLNWRNVSDISSVIEVANYAGLPTTGKVSILYVTKDTNKLYRWNGTTYVDVAPSTVTSVNGKVGAVVLSTADVADTTDKRYQTDAQKTNNDATSSIQTQLNSKATDANVLHKTGDEEKVGTLRITNNSAVTTTPAMRIFSANSSALSIEGQSATKNTIDITHNGNFDAIAVNVIGSGSTGKVLIGQNQGSTTSSIDKLGTITGTSIVKSGAPTTNIMLAGGGDIAQSAISTVDATTIVKGKVKLAGDLGGTADLPTVPKLNAEGLLQYRVANRTIWNTGKGNINSNTSFGNNALDSNTTGSNNTSFGSASLFTNTSGDRNTSVGSNSMSNNTTGSDNTSFGNTSLAANISGGNNSAFGRDALAYSVLGSQNTAMGRDSFLNISDGSHNSGYGYRSGSFLADGTTINSTSNQSLFLGSNTKALNNNGTNEIVIGYNAIGSGSNTATLGNTFITKTVLRGQTLADGFTSNIPLSSTEFGLKVQNDGTNTYTVNKTGDIVGKSVTLTGQTSTSAVLAGGGVLSNPISGTGTTNYLPKVVGSRIVGDSRVFDNGTNVGIGTNTPSQVLEINSTTSSSGIVVKNTNLGYANLDIETNRGSEGENIGGVRFKSSTKAFPSVQFNAVVGGSLDISTGTGASTAINRMTIKPNGIINFANAPIYTNNTTALAGGLVVGDVYKTAVGVLMITY
jgi:hypothetical protein